MAEEMGVFENYSFDAGDAAAETRPRPDRDDSQNP